MSFCKSGLIRGGGVNNTSPTYDMKLKTLSDGSAWARIHWLDVSSKVEWFANASEVALCINQSNRYSRMGIVDTFKSTDGYYEFMLTYPSLSSTLYNRWKQMSSANATAVTGFTKITEAWSKHNSGIRKHGNQAVYDCDSGSTWFAPIGQVVRWTNDSIPAANGSQQKSTELWVRIDNVKLSSCKLYSDRVECSEVIEY